LQTDCFRSVIAAGRNRVGNGPYFEARNRTEPEIIGPNSARPPHLFLKLDLEPKANLPSKISATARYQKTCCMGIAPGTRFYHTQNSNHLDQDISLNKHSLLVNDNTAESNVSQGKKKILRNYPPKHYTHKINYMKIWFVGHRFLKQAKNCVCD